MDDAVTTSGPDRLLAGQLVLVTGASGPRVGAGICAAVHAAGATLVVNDLDEAAVESTVERYPGSVGIPGDVATDADRVVATAVERCGELTGLVNNAGVGLRRPFYDATEAEFDRVLDVDLRAVWATSKAFARHAIDRDRGGAIVNVSSVHAHSTIGRYGVYAAAKAGVEGLTRGCAADLGPHGIRCNAVAPGYVPPVNVEPTAWLESHTRDEQLLRRVIEPVDCGWAVAFLLSELSRCVTGQVLRVDAGLTARLYDRPTSDMIGPEPNRS